RAKLLFWYGHLDRAREDLRRVITGAPATPEAGFARTLLLDSYVLAGDLAGARADALLNGAEAMPSFQFLTASDAARGKGAPNKPPFVKGPELGIPEDFWTVEESEGLRYLGLQGALACDGGAEFDADGVPVSILVLEWRYEAGTLVPTGCHPGLQTIARLALARKRIPPPGRAVRVTHDIDFATIRKTATVSGPSPRLLLSDVDR
ncbi:MAG TPA: hypothetical protein VFV33_02915, partial [Gemmatimonadaceae bacterium]|nr:hypothetical protein [Gemmatimonadaceae bacterium]